MKKILKRMAFMVTSMIVIPVLFFLTGPELCIWIPIYWILTGKNWLDTVNKISNDGLALITENMIDWWIKIWDIKL